MKIYNFLIDLLIYHPLFRKMIRWIPIMIAGFNLENLISQFNMISKSNFSHKFYQYLFLFFLLFLNHCLQIFELNHSLQLENILKIN